MQRSSYLGIDPGRSKTGLALVAEDGSIEALHLASTAAIAAELRSFLADRRVECVIMGDGTYHEKIAAVVRELLPRLQLELVGEAHSTEEARSLYWQEQPPQGWRRLVPLGLLVPPEPLDAYAAVVQVRRWLAQHKE